jgi:Rrf2 family iron-sulfur cluster assembly transcriptional regulator
MRLTREADYAVRVVLDLAEHAGDGPVRSADVARRQMVPKPFLRKVVQALTRSGYVRTRRGTGGGIALARSPRTLTVRGVIEAIEGPISLNRCTSAPGACPLDRTCPVHPMWRRIQDLVIRELESATIESLRRREKADTHPRGGGR